MRTGLWVLAAVATIWLTFVVALAAVKPDAGTVREVARVLPDTLRLVARLARDRGIPLSTRASVWLLLAYLALPVDLVPDFIPIVGYADDAILASIILRRLIRKVGPDKLTEHWPGTPEGLTALRTLLRLKEPPSGRAA